MRTVVCVAALWGGLTACPAASQQGEWPVHAMDRPRPPLVATAGAVPVAPPSDAVILFDGTGLNAWTGSDGAAPGWAIVDGTLVVEPGHGGLQTRAAFGDMQLHIEWATPARPSGSGQDRGNSGVFLMSRYEIQVLDSWENDTYPDGQAAALYGQMPPLVNASRPPGAWQSYDVVFRAPRFDPGGAVRDSARVTVFHNGVLVHGGVAFQGATVHGARARYSPHPDRLPLLLQDHEHRVRFRNIWVRDLTR